MRGLEPYHDGYAGVSGAKCAFRRFQLYHFPGFVMRDKFLTSLGLSLSHPCRGRNHSLREGCAAPEVKYLVHVRPSGPLVPIFTSWGCRDNVEMLSLSVLKARGPKPRCRQN